MSGVRQDAAGELVRIAERLGRNRNGYLGDRIDIDAVLGECCQAAVRAGFEIQRLPASPKPDLLAFTRRRRKGPPGSRLYISTGIHGDEPAGPLAMRQLLEENRWPADWDLYLCPCLNPTGFPLNRRENADGLDLNRQYRRPEASETVAHLRWLEAQPPFRLSLCLHEDWEAHGFYVYELNPDRRPSLAGAMLRAVAPICPIDPSEIIEGRRAVNGLICPDLDPNARPDWPEAFYLITRKTRLSYTLEAPSDFSLPVRTAALVAGVHAALAAAGGA